MRQIIVCFLFAGALSADCLERKSQASQDQWQIEIEKKRAEVKDQEKQIQELFKRARQERDEFAEQFSQRQIERQQQMDQTKSDFEKRRKAFDQSKESFDQKFFTSQREFKQEFKEKNEEFDALREALIKELQKQQNDPEREKRDIELLQRHFREEAKTRGARPKQDLSQLFKNNHQCVNCWGQDGAAVGESPLRVFMSFSVPHNTWLNLSQELDKVGGVFVLRGLPDQSFQALAQRILKLKESGVNAPIQLDPAKFQDYAIRHVPSFVVAEEKSYDKIVGNVSLKFALERMSGNGETQAAKSLYRSLQEKA